MSRMRLVFLVHVFLLILSYLGEGDQFVRTGGEVLAASSTITTKRIKDMQLGEVIQIGANKFVKIGSNQYMAVEPYTCADPVLTYAGASKSFSYTGNFQTFTAYAGCQYKVELWGARGGSGTGNTMYGNGAYVSGTIIMQANNNWYFYLGGNGYDRSGWNGGGISRFSQHYGGGASDLRTINSTWNDSDSLRSRIIVAAGGSGAAALSNNSTSSSNYSGTLNRGAHAGGLSGYNGNGSVYSCGTRRNPTIALAGGGTQISGGTAMTCSGGCMYGTANSGSFGTGAKDYNHASYDSGGGGGGWYGGGGGVTTDCHITSSAGGSSYISGHTGCVAVTSLSDTTPKSGCTTGTTNNACSLSPTGLSFTDTVMIDGAGYSWTNVKGALRQMPNPAGGYYAAGVGHTGNGAARITRLN